MRCLPYQKYCAVSWWQVPVNHQVFTKAAYRSKTWKRALQEGVHVHVAAVQAKVMTDFRRSLPEDARMIVAKNRLLLKATGEPYSASDFSAVGSSHPLPLSLELYVGG